MKHCIIPIFIPHLGCSHKCIFCNQKKITGVATPVTVATVERIIEEYLSNVKKSSFIEVAFYGGSFTALPLVVQEELLSPATRQLSAGKIQTIRISTRPDCINQEVIAVLKRCGVTTIELGAQSLDAKILDSAKRGHSINDINNAVRDIKEAGFTCGLQLMVGLPGESWTQLVQTVRETIKLKPDFVRIYPAVVIAQTEMAEWYLQGHYQPLELEEAVRRCAFMKMMLTRENIPVIRTGLQATEELADPSVVLDGPYHPSFGEMVESFMYDILMTQAAESIGEPPKELVIHHYPSHTSKVRGLNNRNTKRWMQLWKVQKLKLIPDGNNPNELVIEHKNIAYVINVNMLVR